MKLFIQLTLKWCWAVLLLFMVDNRGICAQPYPFQNVSLPWDERVDDLVGRLTLQEVVEQTMALYGTGNTPAIERLGIQPYQWISECLHGLRDSPTTAFPQALGLAATFSPELIFNTSTAISNEVRAIFHEEKNKGNKTFHGLSCFSPVINIMRHPLWGRNQETYGEDPYLSGLLVTNYVHGLQGNHPRYVRANAGCKHFDVHGGPENIPVPRFTFDAKVSMRDWRMTFLPQFKACVKSGTYSLMCSYNSINGIPACANRELLTDIARTEWGFDGYVVSDDNAISAIWKSHHYVNSTIDVLTVAIKAGCNLELGSTVYNSTALAVKLGFLSEEQVRGNVKPLMNTRMRLGEFDPPKMNPYSMINISVVQSPEHQEQAIRAAMMSFVLLKNDHDALPVKTQLKRIAVVGPFANDLESLYGTYAPEVNATYGKTPYDGLQVLAANPRYAGGCSDAACATYNSTDIQQAVTGADMVVICLGLGSKLESEGHDRSNIDLPGHQLDLLKDASYYGSSATVVLLLFNAGPLDITWAKLSPSVHAIMACTYPAQGTGEALFRVFTMKGESSVPAGRLPVTWPAYLDQVPDITNYTMVGRTYRYYLGEPLYPFGYGLSYSTFLYQSLSVSSPKISAGQKVVATVTLRNKGPYDAEEVVQLYMSWSSLGTPVPAPKLQLVGVQRIFIANGGQAKLDFTISAEQMQVWMDDVSAFTIPPGKMVLYAGGQQPQQRTVAPSNVLVGQFTIS